MKWKYLRNGLLVFVGLIILIPIIIYLTAIDHSKKHTARVAALPLLESKSNAGEFRLEANNMEFLVRVAGMQNDGPGLILLHGFPESSIVWKPLADAAAAKGFKVLAFDQRGYSPGARPKGISSYYIDSLVSDVIHVADKVGFDTFHLVGHDWGSGVGWKVTMDHPMRVHTWTAMSIPHVGAFFDGLLNDPEQKKRSSYIGKLQSPIWPELLFQIFKKRIFKQLEGRWKPEEIAEYKAIHSEHGATTAALNWYRAIEGIKVNTYKNEIKRPTLFIWGENDPVVAPSSVAQQDQYIDTTFQSLKLSCGHSLIQEKTDSVLQAIMFHISR